MSMTYRVDHVVGMQIYQSTLDRWTPHTRCRWFGTLALLLGFGIRIVTKQVLMIFCCSSGTREWWTGQCHAKKHDGSLPSCSSSGFWPECFTHRYFKLITFFLYYTVHVYVRLLVNRGPFLPFPPLQINRRI